MPFFILNHFFNIFAPSRLYGFALKKYFPLQKSKVCAALCEAQTFD